MRTLARMYPSARSGVQKKNGSDPNADNLSLMRFPPCGIPNVVFQQRIWFWTSLKLVGTVPVCEVDFDD